MRAIADVLHGSPMACSLQRLTSTMQLMYMQLLMLIYVLALQTELSSCFADCAEEYERQVPKLRQQTLQQLQQSRQSHGY